MWRCLRCKQDNADGLTECWNCLHEKERGDEQPEPEDGRASTAGLDNDDMVFVESVVRSRKANRGLGEIATDFVCLKCGAAGAEFDYLKMPKEVSGDKEMVSLTCVNCGYCDLYDRKRFNDWAQRDS